MWLMLLTFPLLLPSSPSEEDGSGFEYSAEIRAYMKRVGLAPTPTMVVKVTSLRDCLEIETSIDR